LNPVKNGDNKIACCATRIPRIAQRPESAAEIEWPFCFLAHRSDMSRARLIPSIRRQNGRWAQIVKI